MENVIEINPRYFATLNGRVIDTYYISTIHDIESITTPYIEITEELWLALTEDSSRKEFIDSYDIEYGAMYTINHFMCFQTVAASVVDFPKTPEELAIESLQADVANKSDTILLTTAEYEALATNGELNENTVYMLTDDTEEEDLITLVNSMNNIDYDAFLAFDTSEIV